MFFIFLFFENSILCIQAITNYWIFFECDGNRLRRSGLTVPPVEIPFNELLETSNQDASTSELRLFYRVLDWRTFKIKNIRDRVERFNIKQENGKDPLVLKLEYNWLSQSDILELREYGTFVYQMLDKDGQHHTFIDIKKSLIDLRDLLTLIEEIGPRCFVFGKKVSSQTFLQRVVACLLSRRSNFGIEKIFYEKCKNLLNKKIFEKVEVNELQKTDNDDDNAKAESFLPAQPDNIEEKDLTKKSEDELVNVEEKAIEKSTSPKFGVSKEQCDTAKSSLIGPDDFEERDTSETIFTESGVSEEEYDTGKSSLTESCVSEEDYDTGKSTLTESSVFEEKDHTEATYSTEPDYYHEKKTAKRSLAEPNDIEEKDINKSILIKSPVPEKKDHKANNSLTKPDTIEEKNDEVKSYSTESAYSEDEKNDDQAKNPQKVEDPKVDSEDEINSDASVDAKNSAKIEKSEQKDESKHEKHADDIDDLKKSPNTKDFDKEGHKSKEDRTKTGELKNKNDESKNSCEQNIANLICKFVILMLIFLRT